jgi:hypothetical protein
MSPSAAASPMSCFTIAFSSWVTRACKRRRKAPCSQCPACYWVFRCRFAVAQRGQFRRLAGLLPSPQLAPSSSEVWRGLPKTVVKLPTALLWCWASPQHCEISPELAQFLKTRHLPPAASSLLQSSVARWRELSATRMRYHTAEPLPAIRDRSTRGRRSPRIVGNRPCNLR